MRRLGRSQQGSTMVEVILAIAVIGIGGTAVIMLILNSFRSTESGAHQTAAAAYAQESYEAVNAIAYSAFNELADGTYGLSDSGGEWEFSGPSDSNGNYTRTVTIASVERDGNGDIVESGGTVDIHTKQLTTTISWTYLGAARSVEHVEYVTNWERSEKDDDSDTEFSAGTHASTEATTTDDGEVALAGIPFGEFGCVEEQGTYNASGSANAFDIAVSGTTAFLVRDSSSSDELVTIDITDTASPTILDSLNLGEDGNAIAISGDYAYIVSNHNSEELMVVDISNPSSLAKDATLNLSGNANAEDIVVNGDRAYLVRESSSEDEFVIIDISSPLSPSVVSSWDAGTHLYAVALDGTDVYVGASDDSEELFSLDISTETSITEQDSYDLPDNNNVSSLDIDAANDLLAVGRVNDGNESELFLMDISDPASISELGDIDMGDDARDVLIVGEQVIVGNDNNDDEVTVVDIEDTANPTILTRYDTNGDASGLFVVGDELFVATDNDAAELTILTSSDGWNCLVQDGTFDASGNQNAHDVYLVGTTAYLIRDANGSVDELEILDVSDPESPTSLGGLNLGADANEIVVSGNYAYIATDSNSEELMVIDITNPGSLSIDGSYNASSNDNAESIHVDGDRAYLGTGYDDDDEDLDGDVYILDISTPTSPSLVASRDVDSRVWGIAKSGDYLYLALDQTEDESSDEFASIDISTETSPTIADTINLSGDGRGYEVLVSGNYAFLGRESSSGDEVEVIDISSPASLSDAGGIDYSSNVTTFWLEGTDLFVGQDTNGAELTVLDVSTPTSPTEVASYGAAADVRGVAVSGNYVYMATEDNSAELEIAEKYEGGGGSGEFETAGTYESDIVDAGSSANWNTIEWTEDIASCSGSDLQLQIRTATTSGGLSSELWQGPDGEDGDETDFFTDPNGALLHTDHNGDQYFQYRASLSGDGTCTPELQDIMVTYTPY